MNRFAVRSAGFCRLFWCLALTLIAFQAVVSAGGKIHRGAAKKNFRRAAVQKQTSLWQKASVKNAAARGQQIVKAEKFEVFRLNLPILETTLATAPLEFSDAARLTQTIIELPMPDGTLARFRVEESPVLAPEIAKQFPDWKTFQAYGIDDPTATARLDSTPSGFHAQILSVKGTSLVDPFSLNDRENYIVYYKNDVPHSERKFHCDLEKELSADKNAAEPTVDAPQFSTGTQIRTYRLAMAATGEYTQFFRQAGDTDAQAQTRAFNAIVVTVNRVDGIYRRDLALSLTLVSGTSIVFPNASTDPYANTSGDLAANQTTITNAVGSANYDIGHLVGTGGGGVAGLGVTCRSTQKARGLTGSPAPVGDAFDIDYVAHEMGHQMGGNHTFNSIDNFCNGNRNAATAYEPGSGATIMAYAGICNPGDLQKNSIDNFHIGSMTEIVNYTTGSGVGATCGTLSGSNTIPTITALSNYTIPFNTPFMLTANAADADGNALTYSWEEYDAGLTASDYPGTPDDDDTNLTARPLFRSYSPTTANFRMFPSLPYILNNSNNPAITFTGTAPTGIICSSGTCVIGEDLPSIARTMNFRVAARDNLGGIADAGTLLTILNTVTPFRVTTQNAAVSWTGNSTQTVTWDVSLTNIAPISAGNVKISLSTDGGQTFPTVLLASTPNDGSQQIVVPNTPTTTARLKIEAVGNIFFDINDVDFSITAGPTAAAAGVSGTIKSNGGTPLRNVVVSLLDSSTGAIFYTRTDSRGRFRFLNMPTGLNYIITPTREAYTFSPQVNSFSLLGEEDAMNFTGTPKN